MMAFSSILGFDPSRYLMPEAQRYADDDFLIEYEERINRGHPDDYDDCDICDPALMDE